MSFKRACILFLGITMTACASAQHYIPIDIDTSALITIDSVKYTPTASDKTKQIKDDVRGRIGKMFGQLIHPEKKSEKKPVKIDSLVSKRLLKNFISPSPVIAVPKFSLRTPLKIHGGQLAYNFDYRSNIDTPFTDYKVAQHSIVGRVGVTAFNVLPLNVSFFIRRTNSLLFTDINDVRVDFNSAQYAQQVKNSYLRKLNIRSINIKDSLINELRKFNLSGLSKIINQVSRPDFQQKLVECNEIIKVPAIAESIAGADKADSVRKRAKEFMDAYYLIKGKEQQYSKQLDSLQNLLSNSIAKAKLVQETLQGKLNSGSTDGVFSMLKEQGIKVSQLERHLLSIRRLSLGRSPLNYSELTGRNVSLNGINIEYNSWFYFALAAGTVDYRFRDFVVNHKDKKPQYLYMIRLGVGRVEKNYIIFSAYKGKKQANTFQNSTNASRPMEVYGISAEVKYRLNPYNYVIAEVAESASPGFNVYDIPKSSTLFSWKSRTNKAYSLKLYSFIPRTRTRLEGYYRYTGAFFHSFDRFQSNSEQQYWYLRAEQYFWKRQIRINASLRSNEYNNPYIIQQYSSNMIFKTVQVTLRKRRWPIISAGYMPSSQFTKVDNQITENRFHTLNITAWHQYKIGIQNVATTVAYNRFYNGASDSGFIYFNAINFYLQHHIFFKRFTAAIGGSHSSNSGFELNVLEESLQFTMLKNVQLAAGLKINNYQKQETKIGSWYRMGFQFMRTGWFQMQFDNGFIPTNKDKLTVNQFLSISINKTF